MASRTHLIRSLHRPAVAGLLFLITVNLLAAWTQEVYVWQRQSSPALQRAITEFAPQVDALQVLAAEISWTEGRAVIIRPPRDYRALAATNRPIGLVLRIGSYGGPFSRNDATASQLVTLAQSLVQAARAAGITPTELQIDFDCAESKLAGYRVWLEAFRTAVAPIPLSFTALPVWLNHGAAFSRLAHTADSFVLQVHSLEKPDSINAPVSLCDPLKARRWAAMAARHGRPFRLALPTYGYLLAFDAAGNFHGLSADGPARVWPAGTELRALRADARALAQFAHALAAAPPTHCTGVIWFRLPVEGDRLNWAPATFAAILRGEVPQASVQLETIWTGPGLAEIVLVNAGDTSEPPPDRILVTWPEKIQPIAVDGLGGFRLTVVAATQRGEIVNVGVPPDLFLPPGRRMSIAWLRFPHEISLHATLPPDLL